MNAETFAEWMRRRGHRVIQTKSSYWHEQGPRIYQAFPYHWVIEPSEAEIRQLLVRNSVAAVRYSTTESAPQGAASYHVVFTGDSYELEQLPKKARYDVKTGLNHAQVQQIPLDRLARDGWKLRQETLQRQNRVDAETQSWWEKLCRTAEDLPGFETWGALYEGELVASLLVFACDTTASILYQQSASAHLEFGVNNALAYVVTNNLVNRSSFTEIFYGLHSLDAPSSVDKFKFRMNYDVKPLRQRVVFYPLLAPFFNGLTYRAIDWMSKKRENSTLLNKAEGLVRFYIQGKLPLDQQVKPVALT